MTETPVSPLFVVRGDASAEEVAALAAVLHGVASAPAGAAEKETVREWAAPHRLVRSAPAPGPAGWRSSAMPR